jgi:hypothetical protein
VLSPAVQQGENAAPRVSFRWWCAGLRPLVSPPGINHNTRPWSTSLPMAEEQMTLRIVGADLLSVSQAARILERSPDRVRQYADAEQLKCMRFGPKRERYFSPADVEAFRLEMQTAELLRAGSWRVGLAARRS